MRRHMVVLAAVVVAMSAMVAIGGGIPPVDRGRPGPAVVADVPSDVPGQFSTSWTWVKTLYRGEQAQADTTANGKAKR